MPENAQGWLKHLGCSVGVNKVVVFEGSEYSTANFFRWLFFCPATLPVQYLHAEVSHP